MDTLFIANDTYQVMQAVEWACSNNTVVNLFCTNQALKLNPTALVNVYYIQQGDLLRSIDNVVNTKLDAHQQRFFQLLYSTDTEIHAFTDVDVFFSMGLTDIHLHECGDSSYAVNPVSNLLGDDDPFTVNVLHMMQEPDASDTVKGRVHVRDIFQDMSNTCKEHMATVLGILVPLIPDNTVLYVHNEPDTVRYTQDEIKDIHEKVNTLLLDIKKAGFNLWVKDHHKRPGGIDLAVADYVVECPVELLDTDKFAQVLSVRSKCLEHISGTCYNALTQQAATKPNKGFYKVYCRGIEKIYKNALCLQNI